MHWSTLTTISVAAILGAPAPAPFTVASDVNNQGDGCYLATFEDAGVACVEFTPFVELSTIAAALVSENLATRDIKILS
jgi:hypothetical protein